MNDNTNTQSIYSRGTITYTMEMMRKKVDFLNKGFIIAGVIALLAFFDFYIRMNGNNTFSLIILFVSLGVSGVFGLLKNKENKVYRRFYKNEFLVFVLKEELDNVVYNPKMGFSKANIAEKGFVKMGEIFSSEDYLKAEYNGISFVRADVDIKEKRKSGKQTKIVNLFRGRVYEMDFNKQISAGMQIVSKNFQYARTPSYLTRQDELETESVEFNSLFDVFTTHDEAAFYVLTPHMMERLMNMKRSFFSFSMGILGNKMYIAVRGGDSFEPPKSGTFEFEKEKEKVVSELQEIKAIIEELNLTDRTFANVPNSL